VPHFFQLAQMVVFFVDDVLHLVDGARVIEKFLDELVKEDGVLLETEIRRQFLDASIWLVTVAEGKFIATTCSISSTKSHRSSSRHSFVAAGLKPFMLPIVVV
jgi:hypothetical protein